MQYHRRIILEKERSQTHLTEEEFESSNVVIRQAKCLFILTNHISLKTRLWLLLQIIHAYNDLLFDAHKFLATMLLQ